jgi:cell division protein FtsI (penicillin-binding protein 3)
LYYASSFVGYFPADEPKYSCIIVVHKPNVAAGYYGADVAGPVFKRIAQKIFTDSPSTNHIKNIDAKVVSQESDYSNYYKKVENEERIVPNVKGMSGMDAVALLENLGLKVKVIGAGKVKKQSLSSGQTFNKNQTIIIELS